LLNDYDLIEAEYRGVSTAEATARKAPVWTSSSELAGVREKLRDKMSDIFADAVSGDPMELDELYRRLDGLVALYCHYRRSDDGWHIIAVLVSHIGMQLHQTTIADNDTDGTAHPLRSPQGLLRCLSDGSDQHIEMLATATFLEDENAWLALAREILPPTLADTLRQVSEPGMPAVLCVVPHGPLSMIPFAALRLDSYSSVSDEAIVTFTPSLSMVLDDKLAERTDSSPYILTHFGPTDLAAEFASARSRFSPVRSHLVRTAEELTDALSDGPRADVVVVSHHGNRGTEKDLYEQFVLFESGHQLTAISALRLPWPRTVMLGSCWAGLTTLTADGHDPFAFSTACLLGGASSVLGG